MGRKVALLALVLSLTGWSGETTRDYPVAPIPFTKVHLTDRFWLARLETNRRVTIPFAIEKNEETGRVDNFRIAAGRMEGRYQGRPFNDTDGNRAYLDLAKFFLDERGREHDGGLYAEDSPFALYNRKAYMQDHQPALEQTEAVGHAVRASYMYSGMADVAALTGDEDYIRAIDRIWDNVTSKESRRIASMKWGA